MMVPSESLAAALIEVPDERLIVALLAGEVMVTVGGTLLAGGTTFTVTGWLVVTPPSKS
jgi:hypothetical protein